MSKRFLLKISVLVIALALFVPMIVSADIGIKDFFFYNYIKRFAYLNPAITQLLIGGTTTSTDADLEIQGSIGLNGDAITDWSEIQGVNYWADDGTTLSPVTTTRVVSTTDLTATNIITTNLYVSSSLNLLGTVITNISTWFNGLFDTQLATKDTDDLTEGDVNFYDKTLSLTDGSNISITGTYPDFTISATTGGSYDYNWLDYATYLSPATSTMGLVINGETELATTTISDLTIGTLSGVIFGTSGNIGTIATSSLGLPTFTTLDNYLTLSDWYATTTDGLDEGSTNLYYTQARVWNDILASSTLTTTLGKADTALQTESDPVFMAASTSLNYVVTESDPIWTATSSNYLTTAVAAITYYTNAAWDLIKTTIVYVTTAFGGDVSGTYDNLQVTDNSHNHNSTTVSDLVASNFASQNISQWTNDAGYVTTSGSGVTTFIATTTDTFDGVVTTSTLTGYVAANNVCASEYADSHLCSDGEIMSYIANGGDISGWGADVSTGYYAELAPGYFAQADDCSGYTSNSNIYLGSFYIFNATTGGRAALSNCSNFKPLICCR